MHYLCKPGGFLRSPRLTCCNDDDDNDDDDDEYDELLVVSFLS